MFDVFGNALDGEPAPTDIHWRSVHRDPPTLHQRSITPDVFETGITMIGVLVPPPPNRTGGTSS